MVEFSLLNATQMQTERAVERTFCQSVVLEMDIFTV